MVLTYLPQYLSIYRNSLTEMHVLSDSLSVAKERRLMVLDQVQSEPLESKSAYQLVTRKQVSLKFSGS